MGKYKVTSNHLTSGKTIDAHELRLKGNVAAFYDASDKIIALFSVKEHNVIKEK